jgi:1-acyl-sn-glycerol-3-phosphate acyltransferase
MPQTILAFSFIGLSAAVLTPFGLILLLIHICGLKRAATVCTYRIAWAWARVVIHITHSTVDVSGLENIPQKGGFCVVSHHESIFDIILHLAYVGRPFGFIARREIAYIPLIDLWILLLGGLFLARDNPRKAIRTFARGSKKIREGHAMLIFPEGTRSKDCSLMPFRAGAFKLATEADTIVVPASIQGSRAVFETTGRVHPSHITLRYGAPIDTKTLAHDQKRQFLANKARDEVESLMEISNREPR